MNLSWTTHMKMCLQTPFHERFAAFHPPYCNIVLPPHFFRHWHTQRLILRQVSQSYIYLAHKTVVLLRILSWEQLSQDLSHLGESSGHKKSLVQYPLLFTCYKIHHFFMYRWDPVFQLNVATTHWVLFYRKPGLHIYKFVLWAYVLSVLNKLQI